MITHLLGVGVFDGVDRVPTPADDEVEPFRVAEDSGIAENVIDKLGGALLRIKVEQPLLALVADVEDIPEDGKEMVADAPDHAPVNECGVRSVAHLQLHPKGLGDKPDFKILMLLQNLLGVVGLAPGIEDGEGATLKEVIQPTLTGIPQLEDFPF